ncbi:MAG: DUF2313 domain-containing protein [Parvibaculum sp.]|nr:DUF2313 domain-containing protein [Parvibaculum sp.]
MMNTAAYRDLLLSLLPSGPAWPREEGSMLRALLDPAAREMARIDELLTSLEDELDPNTTDIALPEWERAYGLPDACAGIDQTFEGRRERVIQKVTTRGGQSIPFLTGLAAALGYDVTITEFVPFSCESGCEDILYTEEWAYAYRVNAPEVTIREATVDMSCEDPLRSWGNEVLECALRRRTHSHLIVQFGYGDAE